MSSLQLTRPLNSQQQGMCMQYAMEYGLKIKLMYRWLISLKLHGPQRSTIVDDIHKSKY